MMAYASSPIRMYRQSNGAHDAERIVSAAASSFCDRGDKKNFAAICGCHDTPGSASNGVGAVSLYRRIRWNHKGDPEFPETDLSNPGPCGRALQDQREAPLRRNPQVGDLWTSIAADRWFWESISLAASACEAHGNGKPTAPRCLAAKASDMFADGHAWWQGASREGHRRQPGRRPSVCTLPGRARKHGTPTVWAERRLGHWRTRGGGTCH